MYIERYQGYCSCGILTDHRCACGSWWCHSCLNEHTSGPNGRCVAAIEMTRRKAEE